MKFWLGLATGFGLAWAALAIWQERAIPDIDPDWTPEVQEWPPPVEVDREAFELPLNRAGGRGGILGTINPTP